MFNNQYLEAIMDGRMPIRVEVKEQPDGEFNATWSDVTGKTIGVVHADRDEATRRAVDKVKLGIISGELQVQR